VAGEVKREGFFRKAAFESFAGGSDDSWPLCSPQPIAALRESVGSSRGIGTVSQAFAAGTPQLITPFAHDQFDNAARVERLGCGFQIDSSGIAQNMQTSRKRLLEDESIQQKCAAIRSKVDMGEVPCRAEKQ
jgi:hypothetical protein